MNNFEHSDASQEGETDPPTEAEPRAPEQDAEAVTSGDPASSVVGVGVVGLMVVGD